MKPGGDKLAATAEGRAPILGWLGVLLLVALVVFLGVALRHSAPTEQVFVLADPPISPADGGGPASIRPEAREFLTTLTVEDLDRGLSALAGDLPESLRCLAARLLAEEDRLFELRERHHRLTTSWLATGVAIAEVLPAAQRGDPSDIDGNEGTRTP